MPRHIKYTDVERQLAGQAREVAMNRDAPKSARKTIAAIPAS